MKKRTACIPSAIAGTTASHHCLVRHQNTATTSTHTAMANWVCPKSDSTSVSVLSPAVRRASNHRSTPVSAGKSPSGPTIRSPMPTITSHHSAAGNSARLARSRHADRNVGADVSSS